jgi:tRNA(fMet)-specific endonuclease VapC
VICLDSSFLVDYLRGEDYTETFLAGVDSEVRLLVPTVVLHELYFGALRGSQTRSIPNVRTALGTAEFVGFTDAAAEEAAEIRATLAARGDLINSLDMLIAGVARDAGAAVVAVDRDYGRVPNLDVRDPKAETGE